MDSILLYFVSEDASADLLLGSSCKPWAILVVVCLLGTFVPGCLGYITPQCNAWPSDEAWGMLGTTLSQNASLIGPIVDSQFEECLSFGTDAFKITRDADGICMHKFDCAYRFCLPEAYGFNLPQYVADVRTEGDI